MEHRYAIGKVDYNQSGRRNCLAVLTWELKDGEFSMCGEIWNPRKTNCYTCGQCVDTVAAFFPHNPKVQRMVVIWERYHLNHMRAGSPAQMAWLEANPVEAIYPESHYEKSKAALATAGLEPDNGYSYGSAWIKEELPADVVAEIVSW